MPVRMNPQRILLPLAATAALFIDISTAIKLTLSQDNSTTTGDGLDLGPSNTCFEPSKSVGCRDSACQSAVCDSLSDCCTIRWDGQCVQAALDSLDFCLKDWPEQSNGCFEAEPFARGGCSDATCEALVCAEDSNCCDVSYTAACVARATQVCELPADAGTNSCFASSVFGGCEDSTCERVVCATTPSCCSSAFSSICIQAARANPDSCIPPEPSQDCVTESNVGGCDDSQCQDLVCAVRSSCCNSDTATGEWSSACVQISLETCNRPDPTNNCFETSSYPGCADADCLSAVCDQQSFCCEASYTSQCVEVARQNPGSCIPPTQTHGCFETSTFGGCSDLDCQASVCSIRSDCCDTDTLIGEWSSACVALAKEACAGEKQTCFERGPIGGCSDPICEEYVCGLDPFCCNRVWDNSCITKAMRALDICQLGYPNQTNDCFTAEPFKRPGCDGDVCENQVCMNGNPECCTDQWNDACVQAALNKCDFPPARNTCFERSHTPGCDEEGCLKVICDIRSECCTAPYDESCINIAMQRALSCTTPVPINDCLEESEFGGCNEPRCAELVCDIEEDCCDNGNRAGVWASICTRIAEEVCQPEILIKPPGKCPFGFTCNDEYMANCTELRAVAVDVFEIGDIYAGVYCGTNDSIINCPLGHYCPDPETKYICPAGFFCPHKSSAPLIICNNCGEGATQMERDRFGYILLIVFFGICFLFFVYKLISRYNKGFLDQLHGLDMGVFKNHMAELEHRIVDFTLTHSSKKKQKQELEKVRHKVELINRRLAALAEQGTLSMSANQAEFFKKAPDSHVGLSAADDDSNHEVMFDARLVFDTLDADSSGDVTFDELNVILGLNDLELSEFVRRMNELAGYKRPKTSVTRPVFVKYFLQVLRETSNLTVSFEEADDIFDDLTGSDLNNKIDEVHMSTFYHSSMANFLSDMQICDIIKRFKTLKKLNVGAPGRSSSRKSGKRQSIFSFGRGSVDSGSNAGGSSSNIQAAAARGRRSIVGRGSIVMVRRRSNTSIASANSIGPPRDSLMFISRAEFVEHYPQLLLEVTMDEAGTLAMAGGNAEESMFQYPGIDIAFRDLSLSIKVGDSSINVVDHVTGRIRAKTMTALMGGSGAGKTSLLNALCGRAFYGEVTGDIFVNGQETKIEDHKDAVGFVPQDDIVYAELTVRENLIFSGRFRLPRGTPDDEIEDLADETLANLGLSRVANSPVGDVRRRGVSGGEKKRVNIGLELMANPTILFLDEPTSGLDASSALLVMKSLKHLVEKEGVTIVSVIHQPRKFIFDLFDSLILLGVGGRMVYHGPVDKAAQYFNRLNYNLPEGESVADWLIDISSGRLEPDNQIARCRKTEMTMRRKSAQRNLFKDMSKMISVSGLEETNSKQEIERESNVKFAEQAIVEGSEEDDETTTIDLADPKEEKVTRAALRASQASSGHSMPLDEAFSDDGNTEDYDAHSRSTTQLQNAGRCVTDTAMVGAKGVTTGKVVQAFEEAKARRAWLYEEWELYFTKLRGPDKKMYEVPSSYALPNEVVKPSFLSQLNHQIRRAFIVGYRNRFSKFIDACVIIGAIVLITALDGIAEVSYDEDPDVSFEIMVRPTQDDVDDLFAGLFRYAITRQITYPLKVGIILSTLMGLTATRVLTSKRLEFFRESGSGYDINAYFAAINVVSTVEHTTQITIASFLAYWIRNPLASAASFFVHFFLLAWIVVGWALLIPMIVPQDSVVLVAGFFFAFCGLMFSGAFPPIVYSDIYEGGFAEIFAGWIAPTRFFYEALAVGEYRCLPEQSGFTITDTAINREWNTSMLSALGYAGHDPYAVERSCKGWYWSVGPALLIGLTVRFGAALAMHGFQRAQQTKKPLTYEMRHSKGVAFRVTLNVVVLLGLIVLTTWLFARDLPYDYVEIEPDLTKYFFDD